MANGGVIIIPDVHGRVFWRKAVKEALASKELPTVLFLGDYVDPYPSEGISKGDALGVFRDILALKKKHPQQIHLLLGNHDMGYIDPDICECRRDEERYALLHRLFTVNLPLFDLAWETVVDGKRFLFSHAGVNRKWLERNEAFFNGKTDITSAELNDALHGSRFQELTQILADVSILRGGFNAYGSVVWADVHEFLLVENLLDDTIQVFGHSQHDAPVCFGKESPNVYCLDCREAFVLDASGTIRHYTSGEPVQERNTYQYIQLTENGDLTRSIIEHYIYN